MKIFNTDALRFYLGYRVKTVDLHLYENYDDGFIFPSENDPFGHVIKMRKTKNDNDYPSVVYAPFISCGSINVNICDSSLETL